MQELFEIGQPYGDLRPTRMLVGDGGRIKLLGIGFNWTLVWPDDRQAFLTKPDYLSPERIADELNIDIRGDLYSLGCIWHKVLLGEPVFKGVTPEQTLEMHLSAKATPPRETDPRLSASTSQLLLWLLEKNRDARPRTPREFLKRLAAHPLLETEQPAAVQAGGAEDAGAGSDLDRDDLSE